MVHLIDRLNTPLPIWNAGMGGGLAGADMVAAVNESGGFGVLGAGAMPASLIADLVEQTRQLTSRPFGANIILPMSDGLDVEACFDAKVDVLVLFWGDSQPYVADAHRRGMYVVAQCGGPEDAVAAADAGVDAVIVQGVEAGGHVKATEALADSLKATVAVLGPVPVLAAGGITSGADIHTILTAGAAGVTMGTRFMASREAAAVEGYKERLVTARAEDTVLGKCFDIGWPNAKHRVIRNDTVRAWEEAGMPTSGQRPGEGDEIGVYSAGDMEIKLPRYSVFPPGLGFEGDLEAAALYAGESVRGIDAIEPIADIMARLTDELKHAAA